MNQLTSGTLILRAAGLPSPATVIISNNVKPDGLYIYKVTIPIIHSQFCEYKKMKNTSAAILCAFLAAVYFKGSFLILFLILIDKN